MNYVISSLYPMWWPTFWRRAFLIAFPVTFPIWIIPVLIVVAVACFMEALSFVWESGTYET